jgi:hypothetical protein
MPSSRPELIPVVINIVMELQPKSILDIGTGFGKYGLLFREYLDIWGAAADPQRFDPHNWQVRIDGIEQCPHYTGELQRQVYDRLIIGDALVEIDRLPSYDLVFLGDVLGQLSKDDGHLLLQKCQAHADQMILVTTTRNVSGKEPPYAGEWGSGQSEWVKRDFAQYPGAQHFRIAEQFELAIIPAIKATKIVGDLIADPA